MRRFPTAVPLLLAALALAPGCASLQGLAALRDVDFSLGGVADGRLAGVDVQNVRTYRDLRAGDVARLGVSAAAGEMPLSFTLLVDADNPASNPAAQLVELDWTLFVDDRQTVSGVFNDTRQLAPGTTTSIPVAIELDLVRFFGDNLRDLADLALNLAGAGGSPARLRLEAQPTLQTALGPIRYPGRISIDYTVGSGTP